VTASTARFQRGIQPLFRLKIVGDILLFELKQKVASPFPPMYKTVTQTLKIALAIIAMVVAIDISLSSAWKYYDLRTRSALLSVVAQELPPHASNEEMEKFMQQHTARYAFDNEYYHQYQGILPQTTFDKFLFDRKVQLVLKVNENLTLRNAEVHIFYTFL
jgi:hypothetical protein